MGLFGFTKKKKRTGSVYVMESTRQDGSKKIYVGSTSRNPQQRWGEHIRSAKSNQKKSWISRGTYVRPIGAAYSNNRRKAEKTIKQMSPEQKRAFGRAAARRYKKQTNFW